MQPFTTVTGVVAPLLRDDVDTDAIIPAAFMRSLKTDPADGLFARWRYRQDGDEEPSFVLNDVRFRQATFLLAGRNFGCGSSRENAVWALAGFGIRAVLALGFSDIFRENAYKNGLLPLALPADDHARLAAAACESTLTITVDAGNGTITMPHAAPIGFALDPRRRARLLAGQDEIDESLALGDEIARFRAAHAKRLPWLYDVDVAAG